MTKFLIPIVLFSLLQSCNYKEKQSIIQTTSIIQRSNNLADSSVKGEGEWWIKRHQIIIDRLNTDSEMILIGNSIFHSLDNPDRTEVWNQHLNKYQTINTGISGDRTENVIWRIQNGLLENINPKVAIVLIGTNNTDGNHYLNVSSSEELSNGIWKICSLISEKIPNTKIILLGILPYGYKPNHRNELNKATNTIISQFPQKNDNIQYVDISNSYLNSEEKVNKELMPDYLHPNARGHMIMFDILENKITNLMKE